MKNLKLCYIIILSISVYIIACSNPTEPEKPKLGSLPTSLSFTKNANSDILVISRDK